MSTKPQKPAKPYKEYPLFAHASGVWAKKIKGKMRYFGPWADPDAAKAKFDREVHYLQKGEQPPEPQQSVGDLVKQFMAEKDALLATGDLTQDTFDEYEQIAKAVQSHLGEHCGIAKLQADDFPTQINLEIHWAIVIGS